MCTYYVAIEQFKLPLTFYKYLAYNFEESTRMMFSFGPEF